LKGIVLLEDDFGFGAYFVSPHSQATINHNLGGPAAWRKPDILVDAILAILAETPASFSGNQLYDEVGV
jgi:hypothetical protein